MKNTYIEKVNIKLEKIREEKDAYKPKYHFQRSLIWNTIIRNCKINSLNYVHLYIDNIEELLKSKQTDPQVIFYIKNILYKNKLKNGENLYKIRLMLDGYDGSFYYEDKKLDNLKDKISESKLISKINYDLEQIIWALGYEVEIFQINLVKTVLKHYNVKDNQIRKIDIFIKEKNIPVDLY